MNTEALVVDDAAKPKEIDTILCKLSLRFGLEGQVAFT